MLKLSSILTLFFGILCLSISCYEPIEDCLDPRATNYAANADDACLDCCTFPTLKLNVEHRVFLTDTSYLLTYNDSVYTVDGENLFRINNIQFYLSNFALVREDGSEVQVSDKIELTLPDTGGETTTINVTDDFLLINRDNFQAYNLGSLLENGNFVGVRFVIGIENPVNQVNPSQFADSHPLSDTKDMHLDTDLGYVFNRVSFFRSANLTDTIPTIINMSGQEQLTAVFVPANLFLKEGFDITLSLTIDYLNWFAGINVQNDSATEIGTKIVANLPTSFVEVKVQ